MVTLTQDQIDNFQSVLQYDVELYLQNYSWYVDNVYPSILAYFQGTTDDLDPSAFAMLDQLIRQSQYITHIVYSLKDKFTSLSDWFVLDFLEDIAINLISISNTDKFTRSPRTNSSFGTSLEYSYVLSQNDTLEQVAKEQLGDIDSWEDIALRNNLLEIDYGVEGGNTLILAKKNNGSITPVYLNSVVDNLQGQTVYGLDLAKKFAFVDDGTGQGTQDLQILSYTDTFKQAVTILIGLKKGDVPEAQNLGIEPGLIGGNLSIFTYKAVERQLTQTFQVDDTIQDFTIVGFRYQQGSIFYDFSATSFYNLAQGGQRKL